MKKYDKKTVLDYINGEDIPEFDIDSLEDDAAFMIDVIAVSKDKEMYNLCSDRVKNNFDFVRFCIERFYKDEDFITQVADTYLDNCEDEINRLEILILICKYLKNENHPSYVKYHLLLTVATQNEEVEIEKIKIVSEDDPRILAEIGETGFIATFDKYNCSPIITSYFAEKVIERLLCPEDATFEYFIHCRFASADKLAQTNIRSYLISYFSAYDAMLASYISQHIDLLTPYISEIPRIINRWDTYARTIELNKMNALFESIQNYMDTEPKCSYTEDMMLYFVAQELGIEDYILKYDPSMSKDGELYQLLKRQISSMSLQTMSLTDLKHYYNIKRIIIDFINAKGTKEIYYEPPVDPSASQPTESGTIIDFHQIKAKKTPFNA